MVRYSGQGARKLLACAVCAASYEAAYPVMRGTFVKATPALSSGTCDLAVWENGQILNFLMAVAWIAKITGKKEIELLMMASDEGNVAEGRKGETGAQSPASTGRSASIQACGRPGAVITGACHDFACIPQLLLCPACFQSTVVPATDVSRRLRCSSFASPRLLRAFTASRLHRGRR
jgi:hypothetical protein